QLTGSANLTLPVKLGLSVPGVSLPVNTGLVIDVPNIADPSSISAKITPEASISGLLDSLQAVAIAQIVDGLKRIRSFLTDVQSRGIFQQKIPVINRSLASILNTSEKLEALSHALETNPPTSLKQALDQINQLLGSAAAVSFQGRVFAIDLGYTFS